jgi:dTDP-4-amino-4,6-dideoxy-D-galactose acyltransferase
MNILFVFSNETDKYQSELRCAIEQYGSQEATFNKSELTEKILEQRGVNVVVNNGLNTEWYVTLKGMGIVTITLGNKDKYEMLSDIVIDCFGVDKRKYFNSIEYSICNSENKSIWGILNIISKLEWDSSFFNFNIAFLSCFHLTDSIWRQSLRFVHNKNIKLIEYLCNCHDQMSVRVAESNGFSFVDIRLTFGIDLLKTSCSSLREHEYFRKAEVVNIDSLKKIASGSYEESRYFYDGNFDNKKIEEFYKGWVEKAVKGDFDDECWCFIEDENPYAFCTVKYITEKEASIGLVGVSSNYRRTGCGKAIILSTLNYLKNKGVQKVSVVTQGRNYSAQNLYISSGFRMKSTQLWYHKWMY